MPGHKRQHYVPRCYLKPFSVEAAGAAINLHNISSSRAVRNAPVKGQCAKDYLYGHDIGLERALQRFEGEYARVLRVLEGSMEQLAAADLDLLRAFAYLQYSRTDMAMRRMRIMQEGMHNALYEGRPITPPDLDLSDRAMMRRSVRAYTDLRKFIEDLKVCIVKNETHHDFITSDDPSIFTSRFYVQRLRDISFGIASSGALFFLPLTPRLLLMCYDGNVYTVPEKRGCYASIISEADAFALNELQYLKAAENIYFSRWDDRNRVEQEFRRVSPQRLQSWCRLTVLVPDGFSERGEHYRRATDEERTTAQRSVLVLSSLHPAPSKWISKLKYRSPIRTYSDGSAMGHVRNMAWLKESGRTSYGMYA
jgi:hypothetical protein